MCILNDFLYGPPIKPSLSIQNYCGMLSGRFMYFDSLYCKQYGPRSHFSLSACFYGKCVLECF